MYVYVFRRGCFPFVVRFLIIASATVALQNDFCSRLTHTCCAFCNWIQFCCQGSNSLRASFHFIKFCSQQQHGFLHWSGKSISFLKPFLRLTLYYAKYNIVSFSIEQIFIATTGTATTTTTFSE